MERWAASAPLLEELGRQARAVRLAPVTAGCLLVEQALIVRALGADAEDAVALLDEASARASAAQPLSDASASYLRTLQGQHVAEAPTIGAELRLPARLTDRIWRAGGIEELLGGQLERARDWELAALLEGQTMTEWSLAVRLAAAAQR